ncbi:membrane associated rhomboid family serine protease [Thermocatellispora tengchongensis]|uniref:Membrane associated rhomboid family serine protease n=1 Tax=Thermocatellispora tengchongensis TaxID=1073253 RepID=A0A840P0C5_9ACTN|nr:rhomboid family intramembrane serine protease [Thermocatellispora tengchongensis]MBB5130717.1 membrane associated rhomboid family serine protease [Thermocatellispora tengchongensis]
MTTQPPMPPAQPEQPDAGAVPTCYRHPDRETYVKCQRCERPICPDCMREAAVGHQCVECVREANRGVRQARAVFGGGHVTSPRVTYTLLAVNILAYLAEVVSTDWVLNTFAMQSYRVGLLGEWWRLITSAFLHAPPTGGGFGLTHILFNMWALYAVGPELERRLGALRFAALYLISAIGGSIGVYLLGISAVGASGAIYGLFGALFVVSKRLGYDPRGVLWLIGINVVLTFLLPGISWQGHLGGLVTGSLVAVAFAYAPEKNRSLVQWGGAGAILAVLVLLVAVFPPSLFLVGG